MEIRSLEEFINLAQVKIDSLVKDAKLAQDSFNQCVEYFGREKQNSQSFSKNFIFLIK